MTTRLLLLCVFAAGCDLYWGGGGGGDDVCATTTGGAYGGDQLRDPSTGVCSYYGGTPYPCCGGDCAVAKTPVPPPNNDWATCNGRCEVLGEQDCLAASGCRAAYLDNRDTPSPVFWGCWETAPSGPIEGGGCANLDAQACSRHDDCSAVYGGTDRTTFDACIAEPNALCTTDTDCGGDQHCDTTECHMAPCPDCPECGACAPTCYGVCVTGEACTALATESACIARMDCDPVYVGSDCTCTPQGCTCATLTYEACQAL